MWTRRPSKRYVGFECWAANYRAESCLPKTPSQPQRLLSPPRSSRISLSLPPSKRPCGFESSAIFVTRDHPRYRLRPTFSASVVPLPPPPSVTQGSHTPAATPPPDPANEPKPDVGDTSFRVGVFGLGSPPPLPMPVLPTIATHPLPNPPILAVRTYKTIFCPI